MSKKTMLLMAGALTVIAFTALEGIATAKETKIRCEGAGACTFTLSGGITKFSMTNNDTLQCSGSSGSGQVTELGAERESATGTIQILYTGCKEQNSGFNFSCSNTATAGSITTNQVVVHSIALPGTTNEAGVLVTNIGVTYTCAGGFAATQSTGSIIGEAEERCNTNTGTKHTINFTTTGDGIQSLTSYTGVTFKLEAKTSHSGGGSYTTAAQSGTGTMTFNQNVIVTCA
ncbi:MAG TPA: hypothetical protein VHP56_02875 [Solirubrobacterales bacterium]|jgi:hypothetical protein|nr:hypothetical protein [Solirubrobacterales bacterium]